MFALIAFLTLMCVFKRQNWPMRLLRSQVDFGLRGWCREEQPMAMFETPCAVDAPVRFREDAYARVGSLTKRLDEYPPKERALWGH